MEVSPKIRNIKIQVVFQKKVVNVLLRSSALAPLLSNTFTHVFIFQIILKDLNTSFQGKYYLKGLSFMPIILCCFLLLAGCKKNEGTVAPPSTPPIIPGTPDIPPVSVAGILNTAHLEKLIVPVLFPNGAKALGVYIYSNAPNYTLASAPGEGFTCVDDVARAALFYIRNPSFSTDTLIQMRAFGLIDFLLNMQSENAYFYNFLYTGNTINKAGITSINEAKWWSWRALQTLTEGYEVIKTKNKPLADKMLLSADKLVVRIKADLVAIPETTTQIQGLTIPNWLPEGADQAATLILALIPYCKAKPDVVMNSYIKKLADGIILMQFGDKNNFPYSAFISSGNIWHAYGSFQAYALIKAADFLNMPVYKEKAMAEVDNFYPWLIQNGYKSSFEVISSNGVLVSKNAQEFEQIAYGFSPYIFAAIEAYKITKDEKYADMAGRLAAWFFGKNSANTTIFSKETGRCYDALFTGNQINKNSGAESTIEALLSMQQVSAEGAIKAAMEIY